MRSTALSQLTLCITSLLAGCTIAADALDEPTDQLEQALSRDFFDATGTVTVRIKDCPWTPALPHPTATCTVDPDFVLVGGGAEIENQGNALLVASYPYPDLATWIASSKDHYYHYAHRLRAYAIGLKLAGVSSATLRNYVHMFPSETPTSSANPTTFAELPFGYKLIGGGAQVTWSGEGVLLTASYPDSTGSSPPNSIRWAARGKEHIKGDSSGKAFAYAIGVTSSPIPGFGVLDVTSTPHSEWSNGGYITASTPTPSGWVLTSVGGEALYDRDGRMLHQLMPSLNDPTRASARVSTKDHRYWDSGFTTAHAISVKRQ